MERWGAMSRRSRVLRRIVLLALAVYLVCSVAAVQVMNAALFGRADEPDGLTVRYEDVAADYPRQTVTFSSGSAQLTGWLYPAEDAAALVVIAHGLGARRCSCCTGRTTIPSRQTDRACWQPVKKRTRRTSGPSSCPVKHTPPCCTMRRGAAAKPYSRRSMRSMPPRWQTAQADGEMVRANCVCSGGQ